jgi:hypothetical protein
VKLLILIAQTLDSIASGTLRVHAVSRRDTELQIIPFPTFQTSSQIKLYANPPLEGFTEVVCI